MMQRRQKKAALLELGFFSSYHMTLKFVKLKRISWAKFGDIIFDAILLFASNSMKSAY